MTKEEVKDLLNAELNWIDTFDIVIETMDEELKQYRESSLPHAGVIKCMETAIYCLKAAKDNWELSYK